MKGLKTALLLSGIAIAAAVGFIYSGLYPIGADTPHSRPVYWVLETLRERSIARAASDIAVPPLDDPQMLLAGAADYDAMCADCHLKPGTAGSDLSAGLYPAPPNLATPADSHGHEHAEDSQAVRRQFWIIKHGIKASGMPAWGPTHDDRRIWAMVAFLQRLPNLTRVQYQILTARDQDNDESGAAPTAPSDGIIAVLPVEDL